MASTITVSYSEIDTFRQCPLKHQLAYKERWTRPPVVGGALDKGTLWHQVMETHYNHLKGVQDPGGHLTISEPQLAERIGGDLTALLFNDRSGEYLSETHELIHWMYENYLMNYGFDPGWKILVVEHKAVVPIMAYRGRSEVDGKPQFARTRFKLKCKIDLVIRDMNMDGRMQVVDHKSGKDLPVKKALELDDQFGFYTLALRRMDKPIFAQVYNATRTQRNKDPKTQSPASLNSRNMLYRTDDELVNIEVDALRALRAAYPGPKGEDPYSSPDTDKCRWRCDFLEPHLLSRKGTDLRTSLDDFGFKQDFTRH